MSIDAVIGLVLLAGSAIFVACMRGRYRGYVDGVKETERRWHNAVRHLQRHAE